MFRTLASLAFVSLVSAFLAVPLRAQEAPKEAANPRQTVAEQAQPAQAGQADIQWVWGEVVSVDNGEKSITVKYLDYDTDEEKTMKIAASDATTYQEIKGLDEIKAQDTVSIEYTAKDGANVARDITVEKVEDTGVAPDQTQAVVPEKVGSGPVTETEGPKPVDQAQQ